MSAKVKEKLTGAELDRAVAEQVMGWHEETDYDYTPPQVNWMDEHGDYQAIVNCEDQLANLPLWKPSESIKAAKQVVEKMQARDYWVKMTDTHDAEETWEVEFGYENCCWHKYSDSLAEAICLAALAASVK
jgi:hypothetical protein